MNYSRQREAILEELRSRKDHPTAEMIYTAVKVRYPRVSLGTVYRNLSLLYDKGEILKVSHGEGGEHYDGFTHPHNHFVCCRCGRVLDVESKDEVKEPESKDIGTVESHSVIFYGLCKNCI